MSSAKIIISPHISNFISEDILKTGKYYTRAGVVPFYEHKKDDALGPGIGRWFLLGRLKESGNWSDFGGRRRINEIPLQTAQRELGEESKHIIKIDNVESEAREIHIGKRGNIIQIVYFVPISYDPFLSHIFEHTPPRNKYEEELEEIKWFHEDEFFSMKNLSFSMRIIRTSLRSLSSSV